MNQAKGSQYTSVRRSSAVVGLLSIAGKSLDLPGPIGYFRSDRNIARSRVPMSASYRLGGRSKPGGIDRVVDTLLAACTCQCLKTYQRHHHDLH